MEGPEPNETYVKTITESESISDSEDDQPKANAGSVVTGNVLSFYFEPCPPSFLI